MHPKKSPVQSNVQLLAPQSNPQEQVASGAGETAIAAAFALATYLPGAFDPTWNWTLYLIYQKSCDFIDEFRFPRREHGEASPIRSGVGLCGETPRELDGFFRLTAAAIRAVKGRAFDATIDPASAAAMKAAKFAPLIFASDGAPPCNGTIVKSKSNSANN